MSVKSRRKLEKELMRQTILDAAKDIAAMDGWQNVTIRKICTRIGYTAPVIYQHFESKEDLLHALRVEGIVYMNNTIKQIYEKEKNPINKLVGYGLAFWRFAEDHPESYQVMFNLQGVVCGEEDKPDPLSEMIEIYKISFRQLNEGVQISPKRLIWCIDYYIALIHGFIALNMVNKIRSGKDLGYQLLKDSLQHFLESIKKNE
ncbi:MAG: TetR/AcrR family transcriptional regulator [Sphingobacteriales bacterium]|jgi:AcrR family transcriptional regulator|nr:TetR/AcrR family transcriptional regulator [Sphingobacteriales bacterium]